MIFIFSKLFISELMIMLFYIVLNFLIFVEIYHINIFEDDIFLIDNSSFLISFDESINFFILYHSIYEDNILYFHLIYFFCYFFVFFKNLTLNLLKC